MKTFSSAIFKNFKIRQYFDEKTQTQYFSVVDILTAITKQQNSYIAENDWKSLKCDLKKEANKAITDCQRFKMLAEDGVLHETDVIDTQNILKLIQVLSVGPSEAMRFWLIHNGYEKTQSKKKMTSFAKKDCSPNKNIEKLGIQGRKSGTLREGFFPVEFNNGRIAVIF